MKILGNEKQKYANCLFSVNVVDSLDSSYTTLVKKSFFGSADYKKRTFTNGTLEKVFVENRGNVIIAVMADEKSAKKIIENFRNLQNK